jgi:2-polyprenyl-3-methyl-5-hydroxy-6-metoxy-1,4-benzoquinol methylase
MRKLDLLLQRARISQAARFVGDDARVLDIGCADGMLFERLGVSGVGIDPALEETISKPRYRLVPGRFPEDLDHAAGQFDCVIALAVLEHIPASSHEALGEACCRALRPGGRLILTVPSPAVDRILRALRALRLIDGMALEEHFGFEPAGVPTLFSATGFELVSHRHFQLRLNNLFVFERAQSRNGRRR